MRMVGALFFWRTFFHTMLSPGSIVPYWSVCKSMWNWCGDLTRLKSDYSSPTSPPWSRLIFKHTQTPQSWFAFSSNNIQTLINSCTAYYIIKNIAPDLCHPMPMPANPYRFSSSTRKCTQRKRVGGRDKERGRETLQIWRIVWPFVNVNTLKDQIANGK